MASSRKTDTDEVPILNVSSNVQYLKQCISIVETTVSRNITKQIERQEKEDMEQLKQRQEKKRQLLVKIQEAENKKTELQRENQAYLKQIQELKDKENENIEKIKKEIEESKKLVKDLLESNVPINEFLSFHGTMVSETLKLDWKTEVGKVLCPEGKAIVSAISNMEQECDFWNCPAFFTKSSESVGSGFGQFGGVEQKLEKDPAKRSDSTGSDGKEQNLEKDLDRLAI